MSKYLKKKDGSIESAVLKSVVTPKEESKEIVKEYKTSSYFGTKEGSLGDVFNKVMNEKVDNPYAVGMAQAMKATGDKPPLKKSTITKAHDIAKSIKKDEVKEESISEANITLHDHDSTDKDFKDLVKKSNLTMKVKKGYKGDDVTLSGNPMNIEKMLKTMYGNDWSKTYKRRGNDYIEAEYKAEENEYQKLFKKELEKSGKSIASMSDSEKKDFFNKIDTMYKGKNEELTAAQKKLPPALQKAIKDKEDKKEGVELDEDMYTDNLIKNFHGAYTRNVRRPKAYSQSLGLILDKIKKMVRPGSNQYKKAIETLKSIEGFDKITDYQSQILKDFKPIRQKAINIMMNIKKELSALSKVDYNNQHNVNKHIDTLINLNKKLEPEVKEGIEETHSFHKVKQNKKQTQADGEKEIIDPNPKLKMEDVIKSLWEKAAEDKKEADEKDKEDSSKQALKVKLAKEKDTDALEKQLVALQGQNNVLKQKLENEKNKAIKPEPNPETGEVPLTVGIAYKHLRDKMKKEEKISEARWEIEGRVSYKNVGPEDMFHMVIDAPNEQAAERKAYDELDKARQRRKIGPGGGGSIEDADIETIERTNDRLSPPETSFMGNSYDPTQKEEKNPDVVSDNEKKEKKTKGKADTGSPKTPIDTEPQVDYKN